MAGGPWVAAFAFDHSLVACSLVENSGSFFGVLFLMERNDLTQLSPQCLVVVSSRLGENSAWYRGSEFERRNFPPSFLLTFLFFQRGGKPDLTGSTTSARIAIAEASPVASRPAVPLPSP